MVNQLLIKNTMEDMRALSAAEITGLTNGTYSSVQLLGYYQAGDTPAPIYYYLSSATEPDDGGSVIETGGIKLEHKFGSYIDVRYYGCILDGVTDNLVQFQNCLNKQAIIYIPKGRLAVSDSLFLKSNSSILGEDKHSSTIMWKDNSVSPGQTTDENYLLRAIAISHFTIENINLDANGFNQVNIFRNSILELRESCNDIKISDVFFRNAFDTLSYGGFGLVSWYGGADNVSINNVYFDKIGQSDLGIFEGENWQVNGLYSTNNNYMSINIETSNLSKYLRNINIVNVIAQDCKRSIISLIYNSVSAGTMENINISNVIGIRVSKGDNQVGCIRFRGGKSINLSNVTLSDSGGTGIRMTVDSGQSVEDVNISNVIINNITSSQGGMGISIEGTETVPCKNLTLTGIKIIGAVSTGISCSNTINSTFKDILVQQPKLIVRGFQLNNSKNINIADCKTVGIQATGIGITGCENVILNNNNITDATGIAIYIAGASNNIVVSNNIVSDSRNTKLSTVGLRLETSTSSPRISIIGNNFYGINNPVDGNIISIASNIIQDNIVQMGNSSATPFRSGSITLKGLLNQSFKSLDIATELSAVYTQSEVQAILTELRDLKNKLRSAGIVAT